MSRLCHLSVIACILCGCSFDPPPGVTPPAPGKQWQAAHAGASSSVPVVASTAPSMVGEHVDLPSSVSLGELLDYALKTNPLTSSSWYHARAAYADVGVARASYFPRIDVGLEGERSRRYSNVGVNGNTVYNKRGGSYAALDYMLFDFGGREARIDQAQQALIAANYGHNAAVEQVVLQLQRSYCQYVALRFLVKSFVVGVKDAEVNLDAAQNRRSAGVATIADVLQARTALSRAQYSLQSAQGQMAAVRGAVLTAAGLKPSAPIDIAEVSFSELPTEGVNDEVETLIAQAEANNPELASGKARVATANEHVRVVRSQGYPVIGLGARVDRWNYVGGTSSDDYTATLGLTFPLFTGFSYSYELEKAKAEAARAASDYRLLEDERMLAVWTDYYAYKTAAQQIKTTADMFASAQQSYDVALGRYKEGVGSILDLLSAQSALEESRATQVKSYADWYLSLAQLRFDIGTLAAEPLALVATAQPTQMNLLQEKK